MLKKSVFLMLILIAFGNIAQAAEPLAKSVANKPVKIAMVQKNIIHVGVNGMVCDFCAQSLKKVFHKQAGVDDVNISLQKKLITLTMQNDKTLDDTTIKKLVTDAGYAVDTIHRM